MTVRLRAHHLLCLSTYVGEGYSPAFVANCDDIAHRLNRGEDVLIVAGPDDMCAPLLDEPDAHCFGESPDDRDRRALQDLSALLGRPVMPGTRMVLDADLLGLLRPAFASRRTRAACAGCEWYDLCSQVAADGFKTARLAVEEGAETPSA